MLRKIKDKLYYYFAEKNWGVRREYGPYVDTHQEEHAKQPWKHWWLLIRLNWHYRVLRRTDVMCYDAPEAPKSRLPYLDGAESELSNRQKEIYLIKSLLKFDVISFDIFDTLILRPFAAPADLFMIVGKRLNCTEFYRIRTDAEKRAREQAKAAKGNIEVTIYEIYDIIQERTGIPKELGVKTELEAELQYCFANPYMQRIYRLLQDQEKTIIIASDMYLPHGLMEQLLEKTGYTGYERLYVSCDYGCSKRSRSLYEYIKRDFKGKNIIHVGDNAASDIKSARKSGLDTRYYKNVHAIGQQYRADGMTPLVGSAYAGIVNTHLHNGTATYSPYYEYGFIYGGLYVFGFCNWIHQKAKKEGIDKILFLSRDGAIYQKVYRKFFGEIPDEYFFWSRIANTKYTLLKNKESFLSEIMSCCSTNSIKCSISVFFDSLKLGHLKAHLHDYKLAPDALLLPETVYLVERLILDHWEDVRKAFQEEKEFLKSCISQKVGKAKKVAVISFGWIEGDPMGLKYLIEDEFKMEYEVHCWQAIAHSSMPTDIVTELMDESIEPYMVPTTYAEKHFDQCANHKSTDAFLGLFTYDTAPSYSGVTKDGRFEFDMPKSEHYEAIREICRGTMSFCNEYYNFFHADSFMFNISGYDAYCPFRFIKRFGAYFSKNFPALTASSLYFNR